MIFSEKLIAKQANKFLDILGITKVHHFVGHSSLLSIPSKISLTVYPFTPTSLCRQDINLLKPTGHVMHQQFNLLKSTGYVMHQQFNIQQLYALPTLYSCFFYLSENKQRLVPLTA